MDYQNLDRPAEIKDRKKSKNLNKASSLVS